MQPIFLSRLWIVLMLGMSLLAPVPAFAQTPEPSTGATELRVQKTFCMAGLGYATMEELKTTLLAEAKRQAAAELFGELISASTTVENLAVTRDQIQLSVAGLIRLQGNPVYVQGPYLAEVCVTIVAYTTREDLLLFDPFLLSKRQCISDAGLTVREIRERAQMEAMTGALVDYDRRLAPLVDTDLTQLLSLLHQVTYLEDDFLPGTDTYCTVVEGYIIPIEIMAYLGVPIVRRPVASPMSPTPTPDPTSTATPVAQSPLSPAAVQTSISTAPPTEKSTIANSRLAVGLQHACMLIRADQVWCWGENRLGQLGDGTTISRTTAVRVVGLPSGIQKIAAGLVQTCALVDAGSILCWGMKGIPDEITPDVIEPVPVAIPSFSETVQALS